MYLDATPAAPTFNPSQRRLNLFGAFADIDYDLKSDALTFSGGIKGQFNDFSGWDPSPNVRLMWTPEQTWSVWAADSQGIAMPTVVQHDVTVFQAAPAPGATINPNTGLNSEKPRAYEVGLRVQPSQGVSFDIATFYNDYDDLTSTEVIGMVAPVPLRYANLREGEAYGVELSGVWNIRDDWRLSGTYTAQKIDLHNQPGGTDTSAAAAEASSPQQQFRLSSAWNLTPKIEFDAALRFVDRIKTTGGKVDQYTALDLRLSWQARKNL